MYSREEEEAEDRGAGTSLLLEESTTSRFNLAFSCGLCGNLWFALNIGFHDVQKSENLQH